MAGERWVRVTRRRAGVVISSVVVFVAVGAAVVDKGFETPDTTPPVTRVSASSPITGSTTVTAVCKDNVGCAGVSFFADGVSLGAEDTVAPFSIGWDTSTATDGDHALTSVARDDAGHEVTSLPKTVLVANATANIWVSADGDDSGGNCVRSGSLILNPDFDGSSLCRTFLKAYQIAQGGDTIIATCGVYGDESFSGTPAASTVSLTAQNYVQPTVAEVGSATSCVTVDTLTFGTDHIHVYGVHAVDGDVFEDHAIRELSAFGGLEDVVIDDWHGHQAFIGASGVTIQYSKLGDTNFCGDGYDQDEDALRFWPYRPTDTFFPPDNDQLLHSVMRNWVGPPAGQCTSGSGHNDMFQSAGGDNMVIDGNLFYNAPTSNMQIGEFSGGLIGDTTIQNNYFGSTQCCNNLSIGQGHCDGIVIRNNVILTAIPDNNNDCDGTMTQNNNIYPVNVVVCAASGESFSGSYNIFALGGITCGSSPKQCVPSWVNGTPTGITPWFPDLNPADTCARNYVPGAGNYPATDFYGTVRPQGTDADAGPFEVVGG